MDVLFKHPFSYKLQPFGEGSHEKVSIYVKGVSMKPKILQLLCMVIILVTFNTGMIPGQPFSPEKPATGHHIYLPIIIIPMTSQAPNIPSNPQPVNGATGQPTTLTLSWTGGDPHGYQVAYNIYLDTQNPPAAIVSTGQAGTSYLASGLKTGSTYYWKVVALNQHGASASSPVWSFSTAGSPSQPARRLDLFGGFYLNDYSISCAITTGAAVQCWGESITHMTGDPLDPHKNIPVTLPNLSNIKSLAVGDNFACALTNAGGVRCWGQNSSGQLGNGTIKDSLTPVSVQGLTSGVKDITAGDLFACALLDSGAMRCWGNNAWGQLGINSNDNHPSPVNVLGLSSGVTAISAGQSTVCAIQNGGLFCWGSNEFGTVGNIQIIYNEYDQPMPVYQMSSGVTAISTRGGTACAILTGGALKCWGMNRNGQVGNDSTLDASTPVEVVGMQSGVKSVVTGHHTCAIMTSGELKCWGANWDDGEVGNGNRVDQPTPVTITAVPNAAEVATGGNQTCALLTTGSLKCWGGNENGQLGNGTTIPYSLIPVTVVGW
jgi:alpha-tubulin suppressor-like RCC1 family protein